ncbi:hypothetical protein PanWU01x14_195780 [Parasponia andersonii]|uniref:Uncharacterized protein n=1 Tax=Parasponia andersonii TaxID=3476 RepID=A0A2P5C011_PARAD|nr:hypothetical protein PanWU01x14_195780 [Parasponia andersonii]
MGKNGPQYFQTPIPELLVLLAFLSLRQLASSPTAFTLLREEDLATCCGSHALHPLLPLYYNVPP